MSCWRLGSRVLSHSASTSQGLRVFIRVGADGANLAVRKGQRDLLVLRCAQTWRCEKGQRAEGLKTKQGEYCSLARSRGAHARRHDATRKAEEVLLKRQRFTISPEGLIVAGVAA